MVGVINYQVHPRQAYHLMQLVATLIDEAIFRHESAHFNTLALNTLRKHTACCSHFGLGQVG